jgi:hypothetical protein
LTRWLYLDPCAPHRVLLARLVLTFPLAALMMPTCYLGQRLSALAWKFTQRMIGGRKATRRNKKRDALSRPQYMILSLWPRVSGNNVRAALMTAQESVRREITHQRCMAVRESITSGRNRRFLSDPGKFCRCRTSSFNDSICFPHFVHHSLVLYVFCGDGALCRHARCYQISKGRAHHSQSVIYDQQIIIRCDLY